jgi:hypothetical protein
VSSERLMSYPLVKDFQHLHVRAVVYITHWVYPLTRKFDTNTQNIAIYVNQSRRLWSYIYTKTRHCSSHDSGRFRFHKIENVFQVYENKLKIILHIDIISTAYYTLTKHIIYINTVSCGYEKTNIFPRVT